MTQRLLRHIPTGILYAYQDIYAQRKDFEEIIDVEAKEIPEPVARKPRAKAETKSVETTAQTPEV